MHREALDFSRPRVLENGEPLVVNRKRLQLQSDGRCGRRTADARFERPEFERRLVQLGQRERAEGLGSGCENLYGRLLLLDPGPPAILPVGGDHTSPPRGQPFE